MLSFQGKEWLMVQGVSRFSARISPAKAGEKQVHWTLEAHFVETGAIWRRVREYQRPRVEIIVSGFDPQVRRWQELEKIHFWEPIREEGDRNASEELEMMRAGFLDVDHYHQRPGEEGEGTSIGSCHWRVARRDGGWLTVEMAGLAMENRGLREPEAEETLVLPDGAEAEAERREPDGEFWKKHSEFYLVEEIPFGTVTVQVPHNARDVEAYALARARECIGVGEPEHCVVTDFSKWEKSSESLRDVVYVELHFNGTYQR